MRADRLLSILLLLQRHTKLSTAQLATRLEVSRRTIQRDMDSLSIAGVPVVPERGRDGGWMLLDGYQTRLTGLNRPEMQALFLTAPEAVLDALGLTTAAHRALTKLQATLTDSLSKDAEAMRQLIHIDVTGWHDRHEAVPYLAPLRHALWAKHAVCIRYRRGDGATVERDVTPFGLVAKGTTWYLVAGVDDAIRTYRVSRVQNVAPTEAHPIPRPPDFDLAWYWAQSKRDFTSQLPQVPVTLRVHERVVARLHHAGWYSQVDHVNGPDEGGWQLVRMRFNMRDDAIAFVAGFGGDVEVIAPDDLRAAIIAHAHDTLARYGHDTN